MKRLRAHRMVLVLAAGLAMAACGRAQSGGDYREKAAYLLNFLRFVEWPQDTLPPPGQPLSVCVVGNSALADALREAAPAQRIQGRRLFVRVLVRDIPTPDALGCPILFVNEPDRRRVDAILNAVHGRGVLTIGNEKEFTAEGGVVSLIMDDGQIHFEVNLAAAGSQSLAISSKILKLTEIVGH